ncbi:MAG: hypothetical protein SV765_16275 [Pseudomonadota bacterium]|nr:hypothetical protein [Pseudomonadota bacterium]
MKFLMQTGINSLLLTMTCWAAAVPPELVDRSWSPPVALTGQGHPAVAIRQMRDMAELNRTLFQGLEFHQQTQGFVDEMWDNLEDFNLTRFHKMLPEQEGPWRQLRFYGARQGNHYRVGPDASILGQAGGEPARLGDLAARVQARKLEQSGIIGTHYMLHSSLQLGVGDIRWPSVEQATQAMLQVATREPPGIAGASSGLRTYRNKASQMNPDLGAEDIDIIAPLWASFPAMWELLSRLGTIEDVVYHDLKQPYRQLKITFVLQPERMRRHYPEIVDHIENMNRLFRGTLSLSDPRGELLTAELDSRSMRGSFQAFVGDGRILPVKGNQVVLDAPPIPRDQPWNFTAHMNSTMTILGVVTHIENARARIQFKATDTGAGAVAQMAEVPDVRVQGNALGLFPTSMIDVVMPKNLHEIIEEFIAVACRGNDGKGVLLGLGFEQPVAPDQSAILTLKSEMEGLDNFFIRIGMGIVNDRVLPSEATTQELNRLIFDAQEAFAADLDWFEKTTRGRSLAVVAP